MGGPTKPNPPSVFAGLARNLVGNGKPRREAGSPVTAGHYQALPAATRKYTHEDITQSISRGDRIEFGRTRPTLPDWLNELLGQTPHGVADQLGRQKGPHLGHMVHTGPNTRAKRSSAMVKS